MTACGSSMPSRPMWTRPAMWISTRMLPYADKGERRVLGHLRRALEFNLERTGKHGLPCGLAADWNDCLKLGYYGESLFVAFQVRLGLTIYSEIAERLGQAEEADWALEQRQKLDASIQACAWDGDWFIWAIGEDGTVYGTKDYEEGQVYLNTQVWSVISGAATPEQAKRCMETVKEHLATPYGLMLSAPPFVKTPIDVMRAVVFNPGIKENAGIFNHTQGWGVMAECMLGNGDRAYEYYRASMPAAYNDPRRDPPERALRAGADHLFHLLTARGQYAHLLADRRGGLGLFQRHAVHPGHPPGVGRAAHRSMHSISVGRLYS